MAQKPYHISGSLTSFPGCPSAAHWKVETSQLGASGSGSRQMVQIPIDFIMYLQSCVYSLTANSTASGTKRDRERKNGKRVLVPKCHPSKHQIENMTM